MKNSDELDRHLGRAREHREEEPAFFRRLLCATVYAHAPISDDYQKLRLIQFRHPTGFYAVPFFTSEAKAVSAAQSVVKILETTGRELLEANTRCNFNAQPE